MAPISKSARRVFAKWGKKGGRARARSVTPARRSAIATLAARSRWGRHAESGSVPQSIRLQNVQWNDPVWLEEVLTEGAFQNWQLLYRRIADRPFGETAVALTRVLESVQVYAITPLWRGLLKRVQGMGV